MHLSLLSVVGGRGECSRTVSNAPELRSVSSLGEIGRFLGTQVRHGAAWWDWKGMETYARKRPCTNSPLF